MNSCPDLTPQAATPESGLDIAKTFFLDALRAQENNDLETAEKLYRQALALAPDRPSVTGNLASVLLQLGRLEECSDLCRDGLQKHPDNHPLRITLGNVLASQHKPGQALDCYNTVLQAVPDHVEALINAANARESLGQPEEALILLDRAIRLAPEHADAIGNRANVLADLNRFDESLAEFRRARGIDPGSPRIRWNESMCELFLGRFESGWDGYASGWDINQRGTASPPLAHPRWDGKFVSGTLLVRAEQGIGDQILFSSMLDDLQNQARHLTVAIDKRLLPLFRRSFPKTCFIDALEAAGLGGIERQTFLGDIGRHLRKTWDDFPAGRGAFLKADETRTRQLRSRLTGDKLPLCGFSWSSTNPGLGRHKSLGNADLSPFAAIEGVRWVNLQYGDTKADIQRFRTQFGLEIANIEEIDNFHDIDGLAALISACDHIISVSNTTVHLAGALGKDTSVLLPRSAGRIWYWHWNQKTSAWYPSCRLLRQQETGDWTPVIQEAANRLSSLIALAAD